MYSDTVEMIDAAWSSLVLIHRIDCVRRRARRQ